MQQGKLRPRISDLVTKRCNKPDYKLSAYQSREFCSFRNFSKEQTIQLTNGEVV